MSARAFSFSETLAKIRSIEAGKEAAMYGPLRDLFAQVLGYPASDVDIDTSGEGGRPDVTVRAPSGLVHRDGNPIKIAWVVVEAKDERGIFFDADSREHVFALKSKYIGTNTSWFVMVDPTVMVARQVGGRSYGSDIVLPFEANLDEQAFRTAFGLMRADLAGVPEQLKRFREGDENLIASEKLIPPPSIASRGEISQYRVARKRFYATLRESTQHLQDACRYALQSLKPQIESISELRRDFASKYGGETALKFDTGTLMLTGRPQGPEEARSHDREVRSLRKRFLKAPYVARLALEGLPAFQSRTGADDAKLDDLFAVETANLILARVLLLRFFEDHEFFGERRYICNGGIEAFQNMRKYFAVGYTHLLEQAYKQASRLYAAAFDETELDWVFGSDDLGLSSAIEWALFQFSRYDFTTIKGDILTGIYDRFLDREKRKELGEFYTPPSIARYIVRRVGIRPSDKVLDPACGSGTFLIEAYREIVGNDVERGIADYSDVVGTMMNLCGNDLNTFSAVLCQIQLLWHILRFKTDIQAQGFPDLPISSKVNSLLVPDQFSALERFGELDVPEYRAVIGNPPYVRKERSAQDLDKRSIEEFGRERDGFKGVSSSLNTYALFIYRALNSWCRPTAHPEGPGRLGFIVQVSFFDANANVDLRRLFQIGARWTILEVIDLEVIYRKVFDADVLPAIVIFENRPAQEIDTISVRIATKECVKGGEDGAMPDFDFDSLPEEKIPYGDAFSPDGRILTRLTERRVMVLRKLRQLPTFRDAAKPYWVRRRKSHIEWRDSPVPNDPTWEEQRMISRGIVFRSTKPQKGSKATGTHDIYKGENIIAGELQGEASLREFDPKEADAAYLWQYENILPATAYAIAQVAHCPNAVAFNPHRIAFTDTATVFMPGEAANGLPFDLLLMSDIYVWFYALGARMGVLRTLRSHIYPTNFAVLPYSEELARCGADIERLRERLVRACLDAANASVALLRALDELGLPTLKERIKQDKAARIEFGDSFNLAGYEAEISTPHIAADDRATIRLGVSEDLLDWVELNRSDLALGLLRTLQAREGEALSRAAILGLPIPISVQEVANWNAAIEEHSPKALIETQRAALHELNCLVATALGLTNDELDFIERECTDDPFLKRVKPRYPGSVTRKQGFRTGLDAPSRYGKQAQ